MLSSKVNNNDTDYQIVLSRVREFCEAFFTSEADPRVVFHNPSHTEYIVSAAEKIAGSFQLNPEDLFVVKASSYFYCLGFHKSTDEPEEKSAELAEEYLKRLIIPSEIIEKVQRCILATRNLDEPETLIQQIVSDAVFYFLGTKDFKTKNKLMHKEYELVERKHISKKAWRRRAIQLLSSYKYHTDYCVRLLDQQKEENLEKIKSKDEVDLPASGDQGSDPAIVIGLKAPVNKYQNVNKEEKPQRGIETMFRVSSSNHLKLSEMADTKAHIMITVNAIIISVLISLLLRKLDSEPHLIGPAMLLLSVSLVSIVLSILATRPNIPPGTFTRDELKEKRVDLLFFGNYYKMPLADYEEGMMQLMKDKEFLYGSLIKDLYGQGVVLGRKYRLLRLSYSVFMYGLIAAVIAFVLASVI